VVENVPLNTADSSVTKQATQCNQSQI